MEDLASFAWKNWRAGTATNVIDLSLSVGSMIEMIRCIHIGLLCVQENVASRPTMSSVVLMLNSSSLTLPIPSEPAFFMHSTTNKLNTMSKSDGVGHSITRPIQPHPTPTTSLQASENDVSITEFYPR